MDTLSKTILDTSADSLCEQIMQEARRESDDIISQAQAEAARIIKENETEVQNLRHQVLGDAHWEAAALERRILATINLESRRIQLKAREEILEQILKEIIGLATAFRQTPEYPGFIRVLIVDGAKELGSRVVVAVLSARDKDILDKVFFDKIEKELKDKYGQDIALRVEWDELASDIGVILRSGDSRIECDNTFRARLARIHEAIRTDILREVFGNNA